MNSFPLLWFLKHSTPCSLVQNVSVILIIKILPLPTLTVDVSYASDPLCKHMVQLSSITLVKRISLLIHSPGSRVMMNCQLQWGKMLLMSSSTLSLKALTSVRTLICTNAFSIYPNLMLQGTTLLTLDGFMNNKILALK